MTLRHGRILKTKMYKLEKIGKFDYTEFATFVGMKYSRNKIRRQVTGEVCDFHM